MSAVSSLGGRLDERSLCFVIACIVQALDAMQRSILLLYRNLVPENVYLTSSGYAVLMDFRYARRDDGSSRTLCGSPHYLAPEVVRGAVQTSAIDWWSLGVLLVEMLKVDWPFSDDDPSELLRKIRSDEEARALGGPAAAVHRPAHLLPRLGRR